jgi:phospholipase C
MASISASYLPAVGLLLLAGPAFVSACGSVSTVPEISGADSAPPTPTGSGTDGAAPSMDAGPKADASTNYPIKHIVVVVKENHTFDNYFGTFPGAEGTTNCKVNGVTKPMAHAADRTPDVCHSHECALTDWNNGAMDGNTEALACSQYLESDIPNYWKYARTFTLGDHFFTSELGPSFPGHTFVLAAQAGWATGNPNIVVTHPYWGCDQGSTVRVTVQDQVSCTDKEVFPCFKIPSVPDILPAGVDWKFYGSNFLLLPEVWSMFNAIDGIRNGPGWKNVVKESQWDADITAGKLPAVSWLVNQDFNSEHPQVGSICQGENWTVRKLNKLMQSPLWKETAILFTMDDFGGWYDHVTPPRKTGCDPARPYGLGMRVPLLVISPYAKPAYVFKGEADHASIPRFIEDVFHTTKRLHDLDPSAQDEAAGSIMGAFDFNQTPLPPLVLPERTCN